MKRDCWGVQEYVVTVGVIAAYGQGAPYLIGDEVYCYSTAANITILYYIILYLYTLLLLLFIITYFVQAVLEINTNN